MKNYISTFLLMAFAFVVGAQDPDTVVIADPSVTDKLPWLEWVLGAVIAIVPTIAWARGKFRIGKFVALAKLIAEAVEDKRVDANELNAIAKALKELVAKEEA